MQSTFRAAAIAAALFLPLTGVADAQPAKQQKQAPAAKQAQPPQAQPAQEGPPQIALTEQQVQGFVATTPEITKVTSKLKAEPDKKTQAQLDAIAKKGGFASFEEYDTVAANISMVMQGIDPSTKKFGDPKAMIQQQITQVQADTKLKPAQKKEALDELNQALNEVQPIKNQGNIALVEKNYDQIAKLVQQ